MALGANRDYKTTHQRTVKNLARHAKRMNELITQGMSREDASRQAYQEMTKKK